MQYRSRREERKRRTKWIRIKLSCSPIRFAFEVLRRCRESTHYPSIVISRISFRTPKCREEMHETGQHLLDKCIINRTISYLLSLHSSIHNPNAANTIKYTRRAHTLDSMGINDSDLSTIA